MGILSVSSTMISMTVPKVIHFRSVTSVVPFDYVEATTWLKLEEDCGHGQKKPTPTVGRRQDANCGLRCRMNYWPNYSSRNSP